MIIPMLCVTIFVILVVWFLLPRVARLMIHTPTAISIFVCLSMVQLMAVFISMRCTLCGHFLQVALTLILVVGYAIAASYIACKIRGLMVTVCPSQFATRRTLFHVLVGCGLLMLKVSRLKLPVIWLLVSMWLNTLTKSQIWTKHLFQGYLNIYNNYFKAPWMPDRTEANPNELNQDDARYGFRCCHLKNIWTAPLPPE